MSSANFRCRSCGSQDVHSFLDLGKTPLANRLLSHAELSQPEARYPLEVVFCANCALVQITESASPEELFSDYVYLSSYSSTMLAHSEDLVEELIAGRKLDQGSLVVEIASNDGYLLQYYQQAGIPVLGIEPARNIAEIAQSRGIRTLVEFFGTELAAQMRQRGELADIVHANNVMAHIPDINGAVRGIKQILKPDGIFVSESPYVKDLIDRVEFDTIYHEHLFYYSLTSQNQLYARHGLTIFDVQRLPIHGGSLRIYVGYSDRVEVTERVKDLLAEEEAWGVHQMAFYDQFGQRVEALRTQLCDLLAKLKREGASIAAYGASAKGSTLLNYFRIGAETLDFVVDRSPIKQELFTPGTHLPILAPTVLIERKPDYVLLLVWNFAEEILQQQETYRQQGGKFIIPVPQVRVV